MTEIWIPGQTVDALMGRDAARFQSEISRIIAASFAARGMRQVTQNEVKRRVDFCARTAGELRRRLGWPPERIVDQMPAALKAFIDGVTWEPDTRASWVSTDDTWTKDA